MLRLKVTKDSLNMLWESSKYIVISEQVSSLFL